MVSPIEWYIIEQVKKRRIEKGISQSDLAFELEVSNGVIGKIESGKYGKAYNVDHLNELAKILECSPRDFLPKKPI
jgi:transcriptional regulator with XRE-family HTH domain